MPRGQRISPPPWGVGIVCEQARGCRVNPNLRRHSPVDGCNSAPQAPGLPLALWPKQLQSTRSRRASSTRQNSFHATATRAPAHVFIASKEIDREDSLYCTIYYPYFFFLLLFRLLLFFCFFFCFLFACTHHRFPGSRPHARVKWRGVSTEACIR